MHSMYMYPGPGFKRIVTVTNALKHDFIVT